MAGAGWRSFTAGAVLTAAQVQTYLQDQTVQVHASASARSSALGTAVSAGMMSYRTDGTVVEYYNGSSWQDFTAHAPARNVVINGAFDIWQRGTSLTAATTTRYLADRWETFGITSTVAPSQQTFTPGTAPVSGYEGSFFHRTVVASASLAGSGAVLDTKIEDVRTYAGQTVTVSFWAKADASKSMSIELLQNFGSGGSSTINITPSKIAITSSWTRYSYTVAVPSISGKTIGIGSYLALYLWYDAGSDFNARTGSLGNQSGTFDIWGVQLEAGSTTTPFRTNGATQQAELAACQRYYQRFNSINTYGLFGFGKGYSTGVLNLVFSLPVQMRTTPNLIETSAMSTIQYETGGSSGNTPTSITLNAFTSTPSIVGADLNKASAFTVGAFYFIQASNSATAYIAFGAEL